MAFKEAVVADGLFLLSENLLFGLEQLVQG
jgi:hypothetical protein